MLIERVKKTWILWTVTLVLTSGCDNRATRIALDAADRQARQNEAMAALNEEVAGGARRLVEADAQARGEIVSVHRDLQSERARLDSGWSALEKERHQFAGLRRTESILVPSISLIGGFLLLLVLLSFCWYALVASRRCDDTDAQLNELLISEILADELPVSVAGTPPKALTGPSRQISRPTKTS